MAPATFHTVALPRGATTVAEVRGGIGDILQSRMNRVTLATVATSALLFLGGCWAVPDSTPVGTVVASWKYDGKGTPSASTTPHEDSFTTASGVGLDLKWSSGVVTFPDGSARQSPLDLNVTLTKNPGGWHAPSTSTAPAVLVGDPLNFKGDPRDVISTDVTLWVNRGHRELGGTRFDNEEIMVRLHGDGHAKQLREVPTGPGSSTWEE